MALPFFWLGFVLGLGALILGGLGLYYGFRDFGSPDNKAKWRSMGVILAAEILFFLALGMMVYGYVRSSVAASVVKGIKV